MVQPVILRITTQTVSAGRTNWTFTDLDPGAYIATVNVVYKDAAADGDLSSADSGTAETVEEEEAAPSS